MIFINYFTYLPMDANLNIKIIKDHMKNPTMYPSPRETKDKINVGTFDSILNFIYF